MTANDKNDKNDPFWRKQYELIATWQYQEANRTWMRFQISLVLNGGLLAAYSTFFGGNFLDITHISNIFGSLILSILGILLSLLWMKMTDASAKWQDYWVDKGTEIENKHPNELGVFIFRDIPEYEHKAPLRKLRGWIPIIFIITWTILTVGTLLVLFYYGISSNLNIIHT